ncbi:MAG: MptD family putative ECF transporter S component [Eubacteriales bacterium]|nr:MptD family putative ECF transporter S component [Eubacteriales bacterium]
MENQGGQPCIKERSSYNGQEKIERERPDQLFAVIIPLVLGILGGIPFMLFLTKTGKFGAVTIMGTLVSVLCFLMGQSWIAIPFGILFGFLADLIFRAGGYKSWKYTVPGYCVFTEWVIGSMLPMWIMRDTFFEVYRSNIAECCNYFLFIEKGKVLWSDGWNRISRERLGRFFFP